MNKANKKLLRLVNLYRKHGIWNNQSMKPTDSPVMKAYKIESELLELGIELDVKEQSEYTTEEYHEGRQKFIRKVKNPLYKED